MKAYLSVLNVKGTRVDGENPLPMLRDRETDKKPEILDINEWPEGKLKNFGELNGFKVLPYTMLDRYDRKLRPMRYKTVVLENEYLRAEFLLGFGGRLYSLRDKSTGKELMFKNPVIQIGNIAIRNAWITGGVEWNFGRIGHTYFTSAPVFACILKDDEGNDFVRIYEYERIKEVSWQLDFHLPSKSKALFAHGKIVNDHDYEIPLYWWSDMAIDEVDELRVFSGSDEISYIVPTGKKYKRDPLEGKPSPYYFGYCKIDEACKRFGFDITYPIKFKTSDDYFYQGKPDDKAPWISAVYPDGHVFFNRSTRQLINRKMFCWGTHNGGRKWCDHLSEYGKGYFAEIQSGMATTQNHMLYMQANTTIEWTEAFSAFNLENTEEAYVEDIEKAKVPVYAGIDRLVSAEMLNELDKKFSGLSTREPEKIISFGSGFGVLDKMLREKEGKPLQPGTIYPDSAITEKELPWVNLLHDGIYPETDPDQIPSSWMSDSERWLRLLEESLSKSKGRNHSAYTQYGVMLYEAGRFDEAINAWEKSIELTPSPIAYRNIAYALQLDNQPEKGEAYMEKALESGGMEIDQAFSEEYMKMLVFNEHYDKAWDYFNRMPERYKTDKVLMFAGHAALRTENEDFVQKLFKKELQNMREGDTDMTDMWFMYHAIKKAKAEGIEVTEELVETMEKEVDVPAFIDYRIV